MMQDHGKTRRKLAASTDAIAGATHVVKSDPVVPVPVVPVPVVPVPVVPVPVVPVPEQYTAEDDAFFEALKERRAAKNTTDAYRTDLRQFSEWCRAKKLTERPAAPKTVVLWAGHLARNGNKVATIERKLAALSSAHTRAGLASPVRHQDVKNAMATIRCELGVKQRQVLALLPSHLKAIIEKTPVTVRWKRDRAILLLGFSCAMRRSELVAVKVEHLSFGEDAQGNKGLSVFIPQSKTDQEKRGETECVPEHKGNPLCPVAALKKWLKRSGITSGYVFRRIFRGGRIASDGHIAPKAVQAVVRKAVSRIGENPDLFGGHSLRAGFVTASKAAGKSDASTMRQSRHKNERTMRGYDRPLDFYGKSNPLHGLLE